jgi:hypothetical protein
MSFAKPSIVHKKEEGRGNGEWGMGNGEWGIGNREDNYRREAEAQRVERLQNNELLL